MQFDIITIFPDFFSSILAHGVLKRALASNLLTVQTHNLRDFAHDRHRTVDDRPFGGGEGMVLKPEPLAEAIESLNIAPKCDRNSAKETVILLSAQGARFNQSTARELATLDRVALICGRYEGVDERVNELFCDRELSIGDYVLSGGELAAAVILDATMRLIPGVLGNEASSAYESFGQPDNTFRGKRRRPTPLHLRSRWLIGLPPLHPPSRIPRPRDPRSPERRQPRPDPPLAARKSARKNAPKPPGFAEKR